MPETKLILSDILEKTGKSLKKGQTVKAYFDLDSTLFDVTPRVQKIIEDFCQDETMRQKYPQAVAKLNTVKLLSHPYYIKDLMHQIGLTDQDPRFYKEIFQYWKERFFHDHYVIHDTPEKGAVLYVQELHAMGVEIVYLTGRDIPRMQKGTLESLKKWQFPLNDKSAHLVLKPHHELDDAHFKKEVFKKEEPTRKIWFFENEPANIHLVLNECPHVNVIFFDSVHSQKAPPPPEHIPRIKHFDHK